MKYIKIFEEMTQKQLQLAFKNRIDWNFFNYLVDKSTKFSDSGKHVRVMVCVKGFQDNMEAVYIKDSEGNLNWTMIAYAKEDLMILYASRGLYYGVGIYESNIRWHLGDGLDKEAMNEYIKDVNGKCDVIEHRRYFYFTSKNSKPKKEFKEEIADFFKDKIDWRFLNYLKSKVTKYEDLGNEYTIRVVTASLIPTKGLVNKMEMEYLNTIYKYTTYKQDDFFDPFVEDCIPRYEENGLFYIISDTHNNTYNKNNYLDDISNEIKNNSRFVKHSAHAVIGADYIIVTPK